MASPVLIYCAGKNPRFDAIAAETGFQLGIQLPYNTVPQPLYFADQDWKQPDRVAYMTDLAKHRPVMATVLELERKEQFAEVLSWAEEAAQYVQMVIIIPKVSGIIPSIPERIGSAQVVLGYSVPTKYGATHVPLWEFAGRPVHLLGGTPSRQYQIAPYLHVISVDGNYANLKATKFCEWFDGRTWHQLTRENGELFGRDATYEAFRRSCIGIVKMWTPANNGLQPTPKGAAQNWMFN